MIRTEATVEIIQTRRIRIAGISEKHKIKNLQVIEHDILWSIWKMVIKHLRYLRPRDGTWLAEGGLKTGTTTTNRLVDKLASATNRILSEKNNKHETIT